MLQIMYDKLNGLKQHKFIIFQFWRSEVQKDLKELKSSDCTLSEGSREESVPYLFECLEATCTPWLVALYFRFEILSNAASIITFADSDPSESLL